MNSWVKFEMSGSPEYTYCNDAGSVTAAVGWLHEQLNANPMHALCLALEWNPHARDAANKQTLPLSLLQVSFQGRVYVFDEVMVPMGISTCGLCTLKELINAYTCVLHGSVSATTRHPSLLLPTRLRHRHLSGMYHGFAAPNTHLFCSPKGWQYRHQGCVGTVLVVRCSARRRVA
jgi:hypothetical protein